MSARSLVVSGCGAVARLYYAPVLKRLEGAGRVRVVGLCDPDPASLRALSRVFPRAKPQLGFDEALEQCPDLVIVASPPRWHASQSKAALESGAAVLCEKPAALGAAEAREMERAAHKTGRLLAIAMVRRQFPACRIFRRLLRDGAIGAPRRVRVFEGGPFRWPVHGPSYFDRGEGGGVLADVGPHVLDLLGWWLGPLGLTRAADDAMGGVEANAVLEGALAGARAVIRLSRDWQRPNEVHIEGEEGELVWRMEDLESIELRRAEGGRERVRDASGPLRDFLDCFAAQVVAVLDHLDGTPAPLVTAAEAVATVAVIEQAYAQRTLMPMPWLERTEAPRAP